MWDEFSVLPKVEVPETGRAGNILYRKISEIFFEDEMHSDLETISWSPLNPNPVTLRKFLTFQGILMKILLLEFQVKTVFSDIEGTIMQFKFL